MTAGTGLSYCHRVQRQASLMNETTRLTLRLIDGDREALERRALQLIVNGSHEEIMASIEALKPRGNLIVPEPSTAPLHGEPLRGGLDRPLTHRGY